MQKPVGMLLDIEHDNTGDKAIRIVLEDVLRRRRIFYEVASPMNLDVSRYSRLIVGGGQLIRAKGSGYYDFFRVLGPHVLNSVGVITTEDLDYLREYQYVSVRSEADKRRLEPAVPDAAVVPCVALLMEGERARFRAEPCTMGIHFSPDAFPACDGFPDVLNEFGDYSKLFVPFTHIWDDVGRFNAFSYKVSSSAVAPYLQPPELFELIGQLDYFVGSSLHACMFAYANNVPFLAFNRWDSKIKDFMDDRGLSEWLFDGADELRSKLKRLLNNPPDYTRRFQEDRRALAAHLDHIDDIVKSSRYVPTSTADERVVDPSLLQHIEQLHDAARARDFHLARRNAELQRQHEVALRAATGPGGQLGRFLAPLSFVVAAPGALQRLAGRGVGTIRREGWATFVKRLIRVWSWGPRMFRRP